jgi:hypothetical protein
LEKLENKTVLVFSIIFSKKENSLIFSSEIFKSKTRFTVKNMKFKVNEAEIGTEEIGTDTEIKATLHVLKKTNLVINIY